MCVNSFLSFFLLAQINLKLCESRFICGGNEKKTPRRWKSHVWQRWQSTSSVRQGSQLLMPMTSPLAETRRRGNEADRRSECRSWHRQAGNIMTKLASRTHPLEVRAPRSPGLAELAAPNKIGQSEPPCLRWISGSKDIRCGPPN